MTQARQTLISLSDTPYYHCINRCVRRAFLCGEDHASGHSYEHRKEWIVNKIKELSALFAIDVCAYAVMSNHYHTVLFVDRERSLAWTDEEVVERWKLLFAGVVLVDRYMAEQCETDAEKDKAREIIGQWRERLSDISWYMRCLNEHIARQANKEDGCKGRFWEGRFKSQALLEEKALLACMAYVDLNPIRAGLCETLEESEHTSVQARIQAYVQSRDSQSAPNKTASSGTKTATCTDTTTEKGDGKTNTPTAPLARFTGTAEDRISSLPFHFSDYLELVDWTGRAIRADKRGHIPKDVPPILKRMGVETDSWIDTVRHFRRHFYDYVGPPEAMERCSLTLGRNWLRGVGASRKLWGDAPMVPPLSESRQKKSQRG